MPPCRERAPRCRGWLNRRQPRRTPLARQTTVPRCPARRSRAATADCEQPFLRLTSRYKNGTGFPACCSSAVAAARNRRRIHDATEISSRPAAAENACFSARLIRSSKRASLRVATARFGVRRFLFGMYVLWYETAAKGTVDRLTDPYRIRAMTRNGAAADAIQDGDSGRTFADGKR